MLVMAKSNTSEEIRIRGTRTLEGEKDMGIPLNALQLAQGRSRDFIAGFHLSAEGNTKDKSKSNGFAKAIALILILKLILWLIARRAQGPS